MTFRTETEEWVRGDNEANSSKQFPASASLRVSWFASGGGPFSFHGGQPNTGWASMTVSGPRGSSTIYERTDQRRRGTASAASKDDGAGRQADGITPRMETP